MKPLTTLSILACAFAVTLAPSGNLHAGPADIKLPSETARLRAAPLAGYTIATQKCGICHSADYVQYQPPKMTKAQWTTEMTKMQHLYGAPISDDDIKLLGIYLAATYGDATTVTEEDKKAKPETATAQAANNLPDAAVPSAQALLTSNGCLACHALDHKVVGPGYHDVAARYKSDPHALTHVIASIKNGGSGKWGSVAMPPFPSLHDADLRALATYILSQ